MAQETVTFQRLSEAQRAQWDSEGYLVLEQVLSAVEVAALSEAVDRQDAESQRKGRDPDEFLSQLNIIEEDEAFLNLIDHPNHLGIVADLIGGNMQLMGSQLMVRPPTPHPGIRWHYDGTKPYPFPRAGGLMPLLHLKIGWFLTDVDQPDMGNFLCIPGSHVNGFPGDAANRGTVTGLEHFRDVGEIDAGVPGAKQVTLRAGDAILFHNALWHAVARNTSNVRRKNLYYVYGPVWLRLGDRLASSPELIARADPIRRQLLGGFVDDSGGVHPGPERVPLVGVLEDKSYDEIWQEQIDKALRASSN